MDDHEDRRKAPPESPAWQAITQLRLLSDSVVAPLHRIVSQAAVRCGGTGAAFALLRDRGAGVELRVVHGVDAAAVSPESIFAAVRGEDGLLIIDDAAADARVKQCPEVTEAPHVRLFASVPVNAPNGVRVGMLSVFAPQERAKLPDANPEMLASFGHVIELFLQRRADEPHDPDTGMLGPGGFEQAFSDEWNDAAEEREELVLLVFSLPTLGKVNARFGQAEGDQLITLLADLIHRKVLISRQLFGRVSGSSIAAVMPRHATEDLLKSAVDAVRARLLLADKVRVPLAAAAFRLDPVNSEGADPVNVLHASERATALRTVCRGIHLPTFEFRHLRELDLPYH